VVYEVCGDEKMKLLHIADMTDFHIKIDSVIYRSVREENKVDGVDSYLYSSFLPVSKIDAYLLGADINISSFLKNERPDLVIFHSLYKINNIKIYATLKRLGIPYAIRPHGSFSRVVMKKGYIKKKLSNFFIFNKFISDAKSIIYLSKEERLASYHETKNNVYLQNMIDLPKPRCTVKANKLVYLGKIEPHYKNIDFMLDTIQGADLKGFVIELYGPIDEPYKCTFFKKVNDMSNVEYKGEIYGEEKEKLLNSSRGLILLSASEGMPMVVLEALSQGMACFLSDRVNMSEYIEKHNVGLITSLNLTEATLNLSKFVDLLIQEKETMSNSAVNTAVKNFQWDKDVIMSVYNDVIEA